MEQEAALGLLIMSKRRNDFDYLVHSTHCKECVDVRCKNMKLLINHFKCCKRRALRGCEDCKYLWTIFCKHSVICDGTCGLLSCPNIKKFIMMYNKHYQFSHPPE